MSPYQHISFNELDVSCLTEFISGRYHAQVRSLGPVLAAQLGRARELDSSIKQELQAVSGLFQRLVDDLSSHLRKEEFVLFPYVKQRLTESVQSMPLLNSVLQQMRREHRQYTDTMAQIRKLTNNYTAPDDACPQIRLCLATMNEFENDLVEQIYLENNILFPKLLHIEDTTIKHEVGTSHGA